MTTPKPVMNARERLIKSVEHWIRVIHDGNPAGGPQIAAAVAADLFGDITPDITPADESTHIGPIGLLGMWFALYCEESGIMAPGETIPAGIQIDPKLLIPLLSLHPTTFGAELYHAAQFTIGSDPGNRTIHTICGVCKLGYTEHFEAIEQLHMAEIESLRSEIEIMEATTDIQMQAIQKQTETIEALKETAYMDEEAAKRLNQKRCSHSGWSVGVDTGGHRICTYCGYDLDCPHDRTTGDGKISLCNLCGADRTAADYGPFKDNEDGERHTEGRHTNGYARQEDHRCDGPQRP